MLLQLKLCTLNMMVLYSFNTVNGKYNSFVLPSLRSGTCNVWASSSLCSSAASHSAAHTVNGRCCCNSKKKVTAMMCTQSGFNTVNSKLHCYITFVLPSLRSGTCNVWVSSSLCSSATSHSAAHTVNGRCCCN